jgi:hypothetical protein
LAAGRICQSAGLQGVSMGRETLVR